MPRHRWQFEIKFLSIFSISGTWFRWRIWMETSSWGRVPIAIAQYVLLRVSRNWLSIDNGRTLCHCFCNIRWTLYRVSLSHTHRDYFLCFNFVYLFTRRGSMLSTAIFAYAATSPVNGYFGGSLYSRLGGKVWIKQMLVSAFLIPFCVCGTAFFINFIAIYYHASRAIPFGTMVAVTCICIFVILPLTLIGTVVGRNLDGQPDFPCRVNAVPRPIPEKKWFMEPYFIVLLGGVLPFGSIFIEMYFIFTSFWAYKIYYVSVWGWEFFFFSCFINLKKKHKT